MTNVFNLMVMIISQNMPLCLLLLFSVILLLLMMFVLLLMLLLICYTYIITIDNTILVHRLHTDFGFTDAVLQWFSSYLTDRSHYVPLSNHCSAFAPVHSGLSSWPYAFHHVY